MNPASSETTFAIRPYRPADFELLWQIDQQCFLPGIAYTQLDLTGFITRRNAITLVADVEERAESAAAPKRIAGFVVAQPSRGIGQILTLDVAPQARRMGLATRLMEETEQRLRATYGGNYERLVRLKDQYDPTNLFRLNANIKPTTPG